MKPTENAEYLFDRANSEAARVGHFGMSPEQDTKQLAKAISALAAGLYQLSIGLRATYNKLEEVKALMERR
jgi:hypothetical protein